MISNHHDFVYYFSIVDDLAFYWCLLACSWQFDDGEQSCGRTSALCATAPQSRQGYVDLLVCFVLPSVVSEHHTERMNATSRPSSFRIEECWVAHSKFARQYSDLGFSSKHRNLRLQLCRGLSPFSGTCFDLRERLV